ncbi:MATE family efflux transporter [Clostridiales bacterium COT073_COT-073]|nr:MATE family efflux transporter [Clostridiales bacterium COT073_COT-073]
MNEKQLELKNAPVYRLLLKYSIPAIVGMIVNALYNIVDRMFIGNMVKDPLAMSGIGLIFPVMLVIFGFCMLIGIGGSSRISIALGENNPEKAHHLLGNMATMIITIMSSLLVVISIFKVPILYFIGASSDTINYASDYLQIILFGIIFQGFSYSFNTVMRAEGNPKKAMYTMLIGAGANIILDPIFIGPLGLGIQGAAWATIVSQLISNTWVMSHFFSKDSVLKFQRKYLRPDWELIKSIITIGMAPFIMQIAASSISAIANNSLRFYGGDLAIGAVTIVNSIAAFVVMPVFGINQGAQPIIGFNYGAKQFDRVKETWKLAAIAATIIVSTGFLLVQLFPELLIRTFTPNPELIAIGSSGMRKLMMFLPIIGFQIISASYFQAVGKASKAMMLSMLRQVIILIPLLLILPNYWQINGVWFAYPIADFCASIITAIFIFWELKHLKELV